MSCPDWSGLVARRESLGDDPPGWRQALAHLERCPACRREALSADPLLAFQGLAAPMVTAAEVEAMSQAVTALRRASRVPGGSERIVPRLGRLAAARGWARAAAAAALVALGLAASPGGPARRAPDGSPAGAAEPEAALAAGSFVEDLDLADARIYQVEAREMQMVMIVHPSLDL